MKLRILQGSSSFRVFRAALGKLVNRRKPLDDSKS